MISVRSRLSVALLAVLMVSVLATTTLGRTPFTAADRQSAASTAAVTPAYCAAEHNPGKIALSVTNYGVFGTGFARSTLDCFTGQLLHSCEFPRGSGKLYLFGGAVWVGAVIGNDTVVSVGADGWVQGAEFHPDEPPFGLMQTYSTLDTGLGYNPLAVSHRDYVSVYTDTFTSGVTGLENDEIDGRPHFPLDVEITQKSFSWGYPAAEDFVLFEYTVRNIGLHTLQDMYFGIYVDGDVHIENSMSGWQDDITGYRARVPVTAGRCAFDIDLPTAWISDNDGDATVFPSPLDVTGLSALTLLRAPIDMPVVSYNWWTSSIDICQDYGPQMRDRFRELGTGGLGTPAGDRNKYHYLSNGEIDFDLVFTGTIDSLDPTWIPAPFPCAWVRSNDAKYLLSVGPLTLAPGQSAPYYFVYTAGESFHVDPENFSNHINPGPYDPDAFYAGVSFSDLEQNIRNAFWMFDLPGVDTDSDGYYGQFTLCGEDTLFYTGDGVPDLTPGRTVTAYDFLRSWPPDNGQITGDSVTFTWSSCPTPGEIDMYELSVKVGALTVTLTDVQDTSVTVDLQDKSLTAGPVQVEWWVTARSGSWNLATRDGHGMFVYDVATAIEPPGESGLPTRFALGQNFPNPFNPSTQIEFALPREALAVIEVFNISGQKVKTVLSQTLPAGYHTVTWDGTSVDGSEAASGVYLYRLRAGDFTSSKKMILAR